MRTLGCFEAHSITVESALDEVNRRRKQLNIPDKDVLSISTRSEIELDTISIHGMKGVKPSTVVVTIFYWSDN